MKSIISHDPNFVQAFNLFIDTKINRIHTALPGKIVDYNFTNRSASIQPLLNRQYADDTILTLPVIYNVPIIFPSAGNASLIFPVETGDSVLLIFSERSTDEWKSTGDQSLPSDPRSYDLTDAIAIPGLFSLNKTSQQIQANRVELTYNQFKISISPDGKIAIGVAGIELLSLIGSLLQALQTATTVTPAGPVPLSIAFDGTLLQLITKLNLITGTL